MRKTAFFHRLTLTSPSHSNNSALVKSVNSFQKLVKCVVGITNHKDGPFTRRFLPSLGVVQQNLGYLWEAQYNFLYFLWFESKMNNLAWWHYNCSQQGNLLDLRLQCADGAYPEYRKCLAVESIFILCSTQFMRFLTLQVTASWLSFGLNCCLWSVQKPT